MKDRERARDITERLKALEAERKKLLLELRELEEISESRAKTLQEEINTLKEGVRALKTIVAQKEAKPGREPETYKATLSKGTFQMTATKAAEFVVMGLFYIVVTKTNALTQEDIGALSVLTFLSSTIVLLTGLALPTALTKFTSENMGKNRVEEAASTQKTVRRTVITLSVAGFIIAALLSDRLSQYLFGSTAYVQLVVLMLVYTLIHGVILLCNSTLQALYLFGKLAAVTLALVVVSRTAAIAFSLLHMGLHGVIAGYVTGATVALFMVLIFTRGKIPKVQHYTSLKPIVTFSMPLLISSITLLIMNWADVVIVTAMTGDYALTGIYYIAVQSVTVLSILYLPLATTLLPALSATHGLKKTEEMTNLLKTSSRYLTYIIVPCCLGLAVISPTALTFFYGKGYTPGSTALSILAGTAIITTFHTLFTTALTATGKTAQILRINIVTAAATIITLVTAVPILQITGAALARLATQTIATTLAFYMLRKEIKMKIDKEALWKSTAASATMIPLLLIIEATLSKRLPTTQMLIVELVAAAAVYATSIYILKALKNQDFELVRQALPKRLAKYINRIEKTIVR